MKFVFLGLFLMSFSVFAADKKVKLTPFQVQITACVDKKIEVAQIDTNQKLYKAVEAFYALVTSETTYREVQYRQKGEMKKLKFDGAKMQIYGVSDDESLRLISSEKLGDKKTNYELRQNLTPDARIEQLLFRADIVSDYKAVQELRAKQLALNITWSNSRIKSLKIEFPLEKKTLNCVQKELADICSCKH